jgi:hypothetical protein
MRRDVASYDYLPCLLTNTQRPGRNPILCRRAGWEYPGARGQYCCNGPEPWPPHAHVRETIARRRVRPGHRRRRPDGSWQPPGYLRIHDIAIAALLVSAAIGYGLANQNDTRLASEQHSALRNAVEFSPFSPSGEINPGHVRVAEHVARVKNLKFERDPDLGDRELRPVIKVAGRIGGFFPLGQNHSHDAGNGAAGLILRGYRRRAVRFCCPVAVAAQAGAARVDGAGGAGCPRCRRRQADRIVKPRQDPGAFGSRACGTAR